MAHKPTSFKLNEAKKVIVIYTNVEASVEKPLIDFYLTQGYKPMFEIKKAAKTVEEMREELKADADALKKFEAAYAEKNGFFNACKVYAEFKKNAKK